MYEVEVKVRLKKGVADPEGANTAKTLKLLGFEGIEDVKSAKLYRIYLDTEEEEEAMEKVEEMCDKLLANPVIQDYDMDLREA